MPLMSYDRVDMAEERIFEDISLETSKTEKQRKKDKKHTQNSTDYPRTVRQLQIV